MRRVAQRVARLERQRQPAITQADNEWRGIPMRELIRFMTQEERSEFRDLLIIARDRFEGLSGKDQNILRECMREMLVAAAARIEAGEPPPAHRRPTVREVYEATRQTCPGK